MADARLVTFLAAHQFAAQGWFGPFWSIVLWVLLIVALYFGIQWCRKACESDSSNVSILLAEAKERLGCGKEEASSERRRLAALAVPLLEHFRWQMWIIGSLGQPASGAGVMSHNSASKADMHARSIPGDLLAKGWVRRSRCR